MPIYAQSFSTWFNALFMTGMTENRGEIFTTAAAGPVSQKRQRDANLQKESRSCQPQGLKLCLQCAGKPDSCY
jgi:hypothetical protein